MRFVACLPHRPVLAPHLSSHGVSGLKETLLNRNLIFNVIFNKNPHQNGSEVQSAPWRRQAFMTCPDGKEAPAFHKAMLGCVQQHVFHIFEKVWHSFAPH